MPVPLRLPYPGMVERKRRTHPMGPADSPREHIVYPSFNNKDDSRDQTTAQQEGSSSNSSNKEEVGGKDVMKALTATMQTAVKQLRSSQPAAALQTVRQGISQAVITLRRPVTPGQGRRRSSSMRNINRSSLLGTSNDSNMLTQSLAAVLATSSSAAVALPSSLMAKAGLVRRPASSSGPRKELTPKEARAVLIFQRDVRMMLAKLLRKRLADRRRAKARMAAALVLQAWARARVQRRTFLREARRTHLAVMRVQALFRGFKVRKYLRLRRAARVITRALARHYGMALHLSFQFLMHERWVERNWTLAVLTVQRIIRGFIARKERNERLAAIQLRLKRIIMVQSCARRLLIKLRLRRMRREREKLLRAALVLQTFMKLARYRRRLLLSLKAKQQAARVIQLRCRLFLAHLRTRRERLKQQEMWDLWNPKYLSKQAVLPWLKRNRYGLPPPQPTTLAVPTSSFLAGLGTGGDAVAEAVVRLMLSVDSRDTSSIVSASQNSLDSAFSFRELFTRYDTDKLGTISRDHFLAALTTMWEETGG